MLLEECKNGDKEKFSYRIFATDQCEKQLKEAQNGKYSLDDLDQVSMKRVRKWFTKKSDSYYVKPALKMNIYFSQFDLFDESLNSPSASIFGDFDLVICANLLFYYKPEYRETILAHGFDAYLSKPIDDKLFFKTINGVLYGE
jgi:chemotaxis protein methyltransferase CheR